MEYEDVPWQRREWIHVHRDQVFQVFLIEHTLVWAPRLRTGPKLRTSANSIFPALVSLSNSYSHNNQDLVTQYYNHNYDS